MVTLAITTGKMVLEQLGKRQMAGDASKNDATPEWYARGLPHIWRPYAQMKTASPPLPVVRT